MQRQRQDTVTALGPRERTNTLEAGRIAARSRTGTDRTASIQLDRLDSVNSLQSPGQVIELERRVGPYKHPGSWFRLSFKDSDLERDFRREYYDHTTRVFRSWAILFLLFHLLTFFGRDIYAHDLDTLRASLYYARLPSVAVAFGCLMATMTSAWYERRFHQQFFLAVSLIVQAVLLAVNAVLTLDDDLADDEIALPNASIACVIVAYSSYRLRMQFATFTGWVIQAAVNFVLVVAIANEEGSLEWVALAMNVPFTVFNLIGMVTAYQIEKDERQSFFDIRNSLREASVAEYESKRAEFLLYNILPGRIAHRLKAQPTIAERFEDTTVMFMCIEKLFEMTAARKPRLVVQCMNDIFEVCDRRAEQYEVEKVKIIQDKYMCVSGAPDQNPDHAQAMADMMLDIRSDFAAMNSAVYTIRAGMHSGPIRAGVIGRKKFCWDIWGDTVNTAARLEYPKGSGLTKEQISGHIRVSEDTFKLLAFTHVCDFVATISVKGKAELRVYHLIGRKGDVPDGGATTTDTPGNVNGANAISQAGVSSNRLNLSWASSSSSQKNLVDEDDDDEEDDSKSDDEEDDTPVQTKFVVPKLDVEAANAQAEEDASAIPAKTPRTPPRTPRGRVSSRGTRLRRSRSRRRMSYTMADAPVLDLTSQMRKMQESDLTWPTYWEMNSAERLEYRLERFRVHIEESPQLRSLILIAVGIFCLMGIMDPLIGDPTYDMYVVRFGFVVPVWLAHYWFTFHDIYMMKNSARAAIVTILLMVGGVSYMQHWSECDFIEDRDGDNTADRDCTEGAEFYAPLPVAFAAYTGFAVFGLATLDILKLNGLIVVLLLVEWLVGFPITSERVYFSFWTVGLLVFGTYISYSIETLALAQFHFVRKAERDKRISQTQREQADELLNNILPPHVIASYSTWQDMSRAAEQRENVAVLFSDVAGFTAKSSNMEPKDLVLWLNSFFTVFDTLADSYHVEKIKTIGDAYVCCAGLLDEVDRHPANDVVNCAISVQKVLAERAEENPDKEAVTLRIGIHVGPVLAAVIGTRKFQYDLFGQTVVMAEEMESSGEVGRVHISDATRNALVNAAALYTFVEASTHKKADGTRYKSWFVESAPEGRRNGGKMSKERRMFGSILEHSTRQS